MSKKLFSEQEISELSRNKYVKNVILKELLILMNLNFNLLQNMSLEKVLEKFLKMQDLMLKQLELNV
ncbi:Uncharacterised protein [[Clostridium] sordellii]|nr:Uncharacterised protein [[Clostridium] sordellii] [Paeniclostridium sordellii]CEP86925.1 Uncharacterised protein [[Clostridium] sordellii] [Paeniclostridium sordellii]CEP97828.1 Uncharacterised protein [[Clostridium] sordellii] [Paeniclostridium sordellii]CEP99361.1 Uncharacterised protein [[Clostridium] sordellii] [Paeniclostridium sordellii]